MNPDDGLRGPDHFTDFEGNKHCWRVRSIDDGMGPPMWQAQLGYLSRAAKEIDWRDHGTPKQHRGDAEYSAKDFAEYLSKKM